MWGQINHANPMLRKQTRGGTSLPAPNAKNPPVPEFLLTKQELQAHLHLPSTRMVDELMRKRKIPVIRLGHRTVRFSLPAVMAALAQFEVKEVGRK